MICSRNVLEIIDRGVMAKDLTEKVVIGSAICFDECWQRARPVVSEVLFSDARNKFIWGLLKEMKEENRDVDVITLFDYALEKYPQIQNHAELAAYICELTLVVCLTGYDNVVSELLRFFAMENRRYGW